MSLRQFRRPIIVSLIFTFLAFTVGVAWLIKPLYAADIQESDKNKDITIDRSVEDDLYVTGDRKTTINGNVNGDLVAAGGEVTVNGNVSQDVYVLGGTIELEGDIGGNLYTIGGEISTQGLVQRNLFALGGTVNINGPVRSDILIVGGTVDIDGEVRDDVRVVAGTADISKNIGGDLIFSGGTLDIDGNIGGDAHIAGGNVSVDGNFIEGDLVLYGDKDQYDINADVRGEREFKDMDEFDASISFAPWDMVSSGLVFSMLFYLSQGVGLILLGLILLQFMPVKSKLTLDKMVTGRDLLLNLVTGMAAIPVILILFFLLLITIIGWPVLWALMGLILFAKVIAIPLGGTALGRWLFKLFGQEKPGFVWPMIAGTVIIILISLIPILNFILYFGLITGGVGALIRMKYSLMQPKASKTRASAAKK